MMDAWFLWLFDPVLKASPFGPILSASETALEERQIPV